jgi:hypothetical protein
MQERVSHDLAALPKRILAARLTLDLAAVRGSFVYPPVAPSNYLPKEPWLAETFESP